MEQLVERIIKKYGAGISLLRGDTWTQFFGFLQPLRRSNAQQFERLVTPVGELPAGQYVLIAEASCGVAVGDILKIGEHCYDVRRTEVIYGPEQAAYLWGLCRKREVV